MYMYVYDPEPELEPEPEPYSDEMSKPEPEPEPSSNFSVPQPWLFHTKMFNKSVFNQTVIFLPTNDTNRYPPPPAGEREGGIFSNIYCIPDIYHHVCYFQQNKL